MGNYQRLEKKVEELKKKVSNNVTYVYRTEYVGASQYSGRKRRRRAWDNYGK